MDRAKVFISCGQSKSTNEGAIAHAVGDVLRELGFDFYIAVEEQSLSGLVENIYGQLSDAEYFLFIDFKRERLIRTWAGTEEQRREFESGEHRGSLFSHQELAIASYLGLPVIGFYEAGTKRQEGVSGFLQANFAEFEARDQIPELVRAGVSELVAAGTWSPSWKNQLTLGIAEPRFVDANVGEPSPVRHYHIEAVNRHWRKPCNRCQCYLRAIYNMQQRTFENPKLAELKWAGSVLPGVYIPPRGSRKIDAFGLSHCAPDRMRFNLWTDSTEYLPRISGPGTYVLTHEVASSDFPSVQMNLKVELTGKLEDVVIEVCEDLDPGAFRPADAVPPKMDSSNLEVFGQGSRDQ